jgi:hypothetical protein
MLTRRPLSRAQSEWLNITFTTTSTSQPVSPYPLPAAHFRMSSGLHGSHKTLTEKLATCIQFIKSNGFRSFPDFMKQFFIDFPKGHSGVTDGPHQTVTQTLRSFLEWGSLKPVLDGIAENVMTRRDENRDGLVPDYCISPDISLAPGNLILSIVPSPISQYKF